MKKLPIIFTLFLCSERVVLSQTNFVPNGSFELNTSCPTNINTGSPDEVAKATSWYTVKNTPDYFHSCATYSYAGTPLNMNGFQTPASGSAYVGIISFMPGTPDDREIIEAPLLYPLVKNQKYFLKMSVSTSEGYQANFYSGDNKVGMRLSTVSHSASPPPISDFAHLIPGSIILDTLNWVTLFTSFTADSAYKYVDIGNFFISTSINYQSNKPFSAGSYYYIDDVCISTDSLFTSTWTSLPENYSSSRIRLFPNPVSDLITVTSSDNTPIDRVILFNETGEEISIKPDLMSGKIDLRNIAEGLYFLQIISGGRTFFDKVIVRR